MWFDTFSKFFVVVVFGLSLTTAGIILVTNAIYELRLIKLQRKILRHPYSRQLSKLEPLSVVVHIERRHLSLTHQALFSIAQSASSHTKIIVIDPAKYARSEVVALRKRFRRLEVIYLNSDKWIGRYTQTALLVKLDSNVILPKSSLKNAQQLLAVSEGLSCINIASQPLVQPKLSNLIDRFLWLNRQPYNKLSCLLQINPDRLMAILWTIQNMAMTYLLYLALYFKTPQFYLLGWSLATGWLVLLIILSDSQSITDKLRLLFYAPLMYNLFYVLAIARLLNSVLMSSHGSTGLPLVKLTENYNIRGFKHRNTGDSGV